MIFHLPQSLNHYLKSYLEDIIMSELERSQREEVDGKLLLLLFGGLNEIFGTKPDLVCMEMMGKIFRYVPRQDGLANELNKCWTNFLTEALDNQPANLGNYLLTILPVLLKHLEHSPENDGFLKESM